MGRLSRAEVFDTSEVARRWMMLCPVRKTCDGSAEKPNEFELNSIRNDPASSINDLQQ